MKISKEEILHIANLANLNIAEDDIEKYAFNLQDILNFANIVNNVYAIILKINSVVSNLLIIISFPPY